MRKAARAISTDNALPRMSWSSRSLYNLLSRSFNPNLQSETNFNQTHGTMYHQRWRSKRMIRAYHGDHLPERQFKRWFLPVELPTYANPSSSGSSRPRPGGMFEGLPRRGQDGSNAPKLPIASLFVREVERRLDTAVFRCLFASSVYEARAMVIQGKVKVNGVKLNDPNRLLEPGDLLSVEPSAVPMLSKEAERRARQRKGEPEAESAEAEAAAATEEAASEEASKDEAAKTEDAAQEDSSEDAAAEAKKAAEPSKDAKKSKKAAPAVPARPPGVLPFNLPPFAAPFLFVPPYLEVSFATCSAIYLRHPTLTFMQVRASSERQQQPQQKGDEGSSSSSLPYRRTIVRSDLPTPFPPSSEMFSLAWEHYAKNSPRVRGDLRRTKLMAKVGAADGVRTEAEEHGGFAQARAKDSWKRLLAQRRGWTKKLSVTGVEERGVPGGRKMGVPVSKVGRKVLMRRSRMRVMKKRKSVGRK